MLNEVEARKLLDSKSYIEAIKIYYITMAQFENAIETVNQVYNFYLQNLNKTLLFRFDCYGYDDDLDYIKIIVDTLREIGFKTKILTQKKHPTHQIEVTWN